MTVRHQNPLSEAEAVLRRGTGFTGEQLVRLIHEVNPTSRDLGDSERQRRYRVKAALQSLLIERFSDTITAVPTEDEGVVSLQYGCSGADACHAVVDELDEGARAFVRYQLDLQRGSEAPRSELSKPRSTKRSSLPAATNTPSEVDGLLAAGQAAALEYDYELAERCFEEALSASRGSVAAASALLELWVDETGADGQALALESRLPKSVVGNPEIRTWLGIAAARMKDLKRVERLIRGLDSPRLPEILAIAALAACTTIEPALASLWVAQLRSCDPMHPALAECENLLHRHRESARLNDEAELDRLLANAPQHEAERFAQVVLSRWPESAVAARYLQQRRRERADAEAERALELGEQECNQGALRQAIATLTSACSAELPDSKKAQIAARIAEIELLQREQVASQRQTDVLTLMNAALTHDRMRLDDAIDRYLELTPELRTNVRSQLERTELAWVEPVLVRYGPRRAKPLALAVLVLADERAALEREPIPALERLARCAEVLDPIPEAHKLLTAARHSARRLRAQRAVEQLQTAERSITVGDWSTALGILEAIVAEHLVAEDRARLQRLLDTTRTALQMAQLAQRAEQLHRNGDLFATLDVLGELEQRSEPAAREPWSAKLEALRSEIAKNLHFESGSTAVGDFWFPALESYYHDSTPAPWLTPDGKSLVVAVAAGRWLLVVRLDLNSMQVERWARYILGTPVDRVEVKRITDTIVVLVSDDGNWMTLDARTLELLTFREARLTPGWRCDDSCVTRDAHWLWRLIEWRQGPREERRIQIVDIATQRVVRDIGEVNVMLPIPGAHEAEVATVRDYATSMFLGRGGTVPGYAVREWLSAVVAAPSRDGLVAAYCDEERDSQLVLLGPILPSRPTKNTVIENSTGEAIHQLAVAHAHDLVALRYLVEGTNWLQTYEEHDGHLRALSRSTLTKQAVLVTDCLAQRLWVIGTKQGRPVSCEVTRSNWSQSLDSTEHRHLGYTTFESWNCYAEVEEADSERHDVPEANTLPNSVSIWRMVEQAQTGDANDLSNLRRQYHRYIRQAGGFARAGLLRLALEWAFPADAETVLAKANHYAQSNDWSLVHRALNALDIGELPQRLKQHAYHLLATCAVFAGDWTAARDLRQIGAQIVDGKCDWSRIDHLTMEDPGRDVASEAVSASNRSSDGDAGILALRRALREADAWLRAGDPRSAFAAANVPELFLWKDRRLFACATAALLEIEPEDEAERLRREYIISAFLGVERDPYASHHCIPCAEGWDEGRIAEVRDRAEMAFQRSVAALTLPSQEPNPTVNGQHENPVEGRGGTTVPELAHERLLRLHPGLLPEFESFVVELRDCYVDAMVGGFTEIELLSNAHLWPSVEGERERLARHETTKESAIFRLEDVGAHLGYLTNFASFGDVIHWVADDSTDRPLSIDDLDVAARIAELSRCHCVVLNGKRTLELAERLLRRDRRCKISGDRVSVVNAYVWPVDVDSESGVQSIAARLLFVPEKDALPYRVARDLECMRDDDFDTFLGSHRLDRMEAALDPIVDAPELESLLALVFSALFALKHPGTVLQDLGLRERASGKSSGSRSVKSGGLLAVPVVRIERFGVR